VAGELGLAYIPYYPLASGLLTGKYHRGEPAPEGTRLASYPEELTDRAFDRVDALTRFAEDRAHTLLELAIGWLLSHGTVASVIAGATKPEQVVANATSASWRLEPADLSALASIG
jgi:aryl-alcohol dehydrogenase-like predicted oxidoreductase